MKIGVLVAVILIAVVLLATLILILSRYRKCPSDKVMVVYGKVGAGKDGQARSAKCIHGGAAFIIPVLQAYQYMDLTPISIGVDLTQ
ncbi:MAG: flotillin family protein, partial [Anaerovoracaceae bacterium]